MWKQELLHVSSGNDLDLCNRSEGAHTPRGNNSTSVHVLKGKAHSYIQTHVEYTKIHHIFSLKANVSKFYKVTHYKHSPITIQSHNKLSTKFKNEKRLPSCE